MRQDTFPAFWLFAICSLLLLLAGAARADGVLLSATGTVHVQKVFGGSKIVGPGSTFKPGETISVEKGGAARIRFTDGSELALKSGTRIKLDKYNYVETRPEEDAMSYSLVQGGLRAISGAIGKRGNRDAYQAKTPGGTIGIRGTQFFVISCEAGCEEILKDLPPEIAAQVKPGSVFFGVAEGAVEVSNGGGSGVFSAGQWGLLPAVGMPPIPLPGEPPLRKAFQTSASAALGALGVSRDANCKVK